VFERDALFTYTGGSSENRTARQISGLGIPRPLCAHVSEPHNLSVGKNDAMQHDADDSMEYCFILEIPDERTRDWPLLSNPIPVTIFTLAWLVFVLKLGPAMMRNRKPFSFRGFIFIINVLQVVLNAYVTYEVNFNNFKEF
jgi:GNS1/SUR4 family